MKYNFFRYTMLLGFIFVVFSSLFLSYSTLDALADTYGNFGLDATVGEGPEDALSKDSPGVLAGRIIGVVLSLIGVVFFALVIFAGLSWMLASGNEQKIAQAKQIIVASIIGLLIVLSAYAITAYVGDILTK